MASVELNWTDNSGSETGFPIYRSTASSPSFPADYTKIHTAAADAVTWTDTAAPDGSEVWYAVTAENGDGESFPTTSSITTAPVSLNMTATVGLLSGSPVSPAFSPGPTVVSGETPSATTSGSSGSVTPYGVQLTGSPATGSLAAPSSALVPGPVSATSTVGVVSVQGLSGFVVSQDGTTIYADPGLLGSSAPSPTPLSGPVFVAGQAAQLAASATFGSVVPDTIRVNGTGATGSLAASNPALIPGPLSAVSDPGSVLATAPGSGLVAGPALVSGDTASMNLAALLARLGADGVILADLASGSLFAGFDGLSPGPAPLFAEIATSTAVIPENAAFWPGNADFAADVADMAALAAESGFSVGTAPLSADVAGVGLSVPAGWEISSFLAARRARATETGNGLGLSGSLTGSDAAGSSKNSVDVRERD